MLHLARRNLTVNSGPAKRIRWGISWCAMLHKCANPECDNQYKYFSEGVLFEFQVDRDNNYLPLTVPAAGERRREIFWLCDGCSRRFTLECREGYVRVAPASARRKTA